MIPCMSFWSTILELDSLYETSGKTMWSFTGKASFFRNGRRETITITTPILASGVSEADALSHVKFKIRERNKLNINTKIDLFDYSIKPPKSKSAVHPASERHVEDNTPAFTQITFDI